MIDSSLRAIQSRWAADGFNFVEWHDPPGKNWPPIIHPVDEVVYLIEGTLVFVVDGEHIRVEPGQEIFVPAGATHTVHNNSDSMNHWCYGYRLNSNGTASLRKG